MLQPKNELVPGKDNVLRSLGISLEFISGASLFSIASFFRCVTNRIERQSQVQISFCLPVCCLSSCPLSSAPEAFITLSSGPARLPMVKIPGCAAPSHSAPQTWGTFTAHFSGLFICAPPFSWGPQPFAVCHTAFDLCPVGSKGG